MDFSSDSFYDAIDSSIQKSGLILTGQFPKGTKVLGKQIEQRLYSGLQKRLWNALKEVDESQFQYEVSQKLENAIDAWRRRMYEGVEETDKELLRRGFYAGLAESNAKPNMEDFEQRLEIMVNDPNRMEPKFQELRKEVLNRIQKIIANSYNINNTLNKEQLENEIVDYLEKVRNRLQLITRTEVGSFSTAGKLIAWSLDPDRYKYDYFWNNFPSPTSKYISIWRNNQNPMAWPEILFMWQHQSQDFGKPVGIQHDFYNQKCGISRSNSMNEVENKTNRWKGVPGFFKTMDLGIEDE